MRQSLDSSRPIMAPSVTSNRASTRFSMYSIAPSVQTVSSTDSAHAEITYITRGLDKLENKKLASQRFVPSAEKSESLSKLALGAKLERALGRRMSSQDAVMRTKKAPAPADDEKNEVKSTVTDTAALPVESEKVEVN